MDAVDKETLRRVEENDAELTHLFIGVDKPLEDDSDYPSSGPVGVFDSTVESNFSLLGDALKENTHVTSLLVETHHKTALTTGNLYFYGCLKDNSSIHELLLRFSMDNNHQGIVCGVGREVLNAYENSSILTRLLIRHSNLQNGGDNFLANTIKSCSNLQCVSFIYSGITDEQLVPIVEAIRQHHTVDELRLAGNQIGNAGCETIATLLEDSCSNIRILGLTNNVIGNEGTITISNSLANNNRLRELYLPDNPIDESVEDVHFRMLVGDMSSIDSLYDSNHTLSEFSLRQFGRPSLLITLFMINEGTNTNSNAALKILKYIDLDMEPLFKWGCIEEGGDDEYSLRALPYVIAWFERVTDAIAELRAWVPWERESFKTETKKLSAIYQFARSMPLLFAPVSSLEVGVGGVEKEESKVQDMGEAGALRSGLLFGNYDDSTSCEEDKSVGAASSSEERGIPVGKTEADSIDMTKLIEATKAACEAQGLNEPTPLRKWLHSTAMATYKNHSTTYPSNKAKVILYPNKGWEGAEKEEKRSNHT